MKIGWSTDFVLLNGEAPAAEQIAIARESTAKWILIHRYGGTWRYVLSRPEFDGLLSVHYANGPADGLDLRTALDLHEGNASHQVPPEATGEAFNDSQPSPTMASRGDAAAEDGSEVDSRARLVTVDAAGKSIQVGGPDVVRNNVKRGIGRLGQPNRVPATRPQLVGRPKPGQGGATSSRPAPPSSRPQRPGAPPPGSSPGRPGPTPLELVGKPIRRDAAGPGTAGPGRPAAPGRPGIPAGMRKPMAPGELMWLRKLSGRSAAAPASSTEQIDDEGTAPIRYPSIEPLGSVSPGMPIIFEIDLLQQRSQDTVGEALTLGTLTPSWSALEVTVTLVSAAVDFDDEAKGVVTIRRNDRSQPARVSGSVRTDVMVGSTIDVSAQFWFGTRFSGMAVRSLSVVSAADATSTSSESAPSADTSASHVVASAVTTAAPDAASPESKRNSGTHGETRGSVQVDTAAVMPDITIYITVYDPAAPGRMHWRMVITPPFATLPPKLDGLIDLGADPRAEAAAMCKQFANLERGKHERTFLGFGESLWDRAPAEFRNVYWALHDHFQRRLTVQFVSDDPYLPWELMAPYRTVAGAPERHGPIALRHAVARWISRYAGLMRNTLPAGRIVTIAPKYKRANLKLSQAETTAEALRISFQADAVEGTCTAMLKLLEDPPASPVCLLYFTGHGAASANSAAASLIKLEDGTLSVNDVAQQGVQLGRRDGTLVFFNACEVGATADLLGAVGGWASAFLAREFRAFVAPLWAIDEEDAVTVTTELMTKIVREGQSVGAALRDVREAHGPVSPTFYSYLLFGDVTAHFLQPNVPPPSVIP